jgi:DNA modification methylase
VTVRLLQGHVLDVLAGAGTSGLVAQQLGRNAILVELSPEYVDMTRRRLQNDAGMFYQEAAE